MVKYAICEEEVHLLLTSIIIRYQHKLGCKQATRWPCIHGLAASAGAWMMAIDHCHPMGQMARGLSYFVLLLPLLLSLFDL